MTQHERLKILRNELKFSQKEFATSLGFKQSYYSEVENGKRPITWKVVENLAKKYNVSSDWIYTGSGEKYLTNSDSTDSPKKVSEKSPTEISLFGQDRRRFKPYLFYKNLSDQDLEFELSIEVEAFKDAYEDWKKLNEVLHFLNPPQFLLEKFPLLPSFSEHLRGCDADFIEMHKGKKEDNQFKIIKIVDLYQENTDHCRLMLSKLIKYMHQYSDLILLNIAKEGATLRKGKSKIKL